MKNALYLFAIVFLFSRENHLEAKKNDFQLHFYDGMPGCQCFLHCACYSPLPGAIENLERPGMVHRNMKEQDEIWHTFIKRVLKMHRYASYACADSRDLPFPLNSKDELFHCFHYHEIHDCSLLSNYLNNLQRFSGVVEERKNYCLSLHAKWKEENLGIKINSPLVVREAEKELVRIEELREEIVQNYSRLLAGCPHDSHPDNLAYIYNKGLMAMMYGDMSDCLANIKQFIKCCKQSRRLDLLTSNVYQQKGDAYFAVGIYDKAIKALTKAITKDPSNKNAYFSRAQAYFENGNFDSAVEDYIASEKSQNIKNVQLLTSIEFHDALLKGLYEGAKESATDFFPSLYNTANGLGESLWVFVNHPVDSSKQLANSCYELTEVCVQNIKKIAALDQAKLDRIAVELKELYEKFDRLNDAEKGALIGKTIGKYGIDIFLTRGLGKGAGGIKKLAITRKAKEANAMCNLEAMASSQANKEVVAAKIAERHVQKEAIRKELKIDVDKQNKHIVGKHNFEPKRRRSELEHPDPQGLVNKFAGKGKPEGKTLAGSPGHKEIVNFGEFIGYTVDENTGEKIATTWGKIHYAKSGVHIVPTNPRE